MPSDIKYIIVDDNRLDQLSLLQQTNAIPTLKNAGECYNASEAIFAINNFEPEIVFLDIDMPGLNGIELLKLCRDKIPVPIFVTSHMEYALESFELEVFDYILKPVTAARFSQVIHRAIDFLEMKKKSLSYDIAVEQNKIMIKEGYNQIVLDVKEIIYLEALKDYTQVFYNKKKYLTRMPLTLLLKKLPPEKFPQIHRSYAVNRDKVKALQNSRILVDEAWLPIGKTYRSQCSTWLV